MLLVNLRVLVLGRFSLGMTRGVAGPSRLGVHLLVGRFSSFTRFENLFFERGNEKLLRREALNIRFVQQWPELPLRPRTAHKNVQRQDPNKSVREGPHKLVRD